VVFQVACSAWCSGRLPLRPGCVYARHLAGEQRTTGAFATALSTAPICQRTAWWEPSLFSVEWLANKQPPRPPSSAVTAALGFEFDLTWQATIPPANGLGLGPPRVRVARLGAEAQLAASS